MSFDRLIQKIIHLQNPTVAGLDPDFDRLPDFIREDSVRRHGLTLEAAADAIFTFNKGLIDALSGIVPAVKPQCAYYEKYGWQGVKALSDTIRYAKQKGLFVITDGKRNDIGTTMEAYAAAHLGRVSVGTSEFEPFGADALTVNGYLGTDGIAPALSACQTFDKGIFVLVKTSNRSSGELQDQRIDGKAVYERMGRMCEEWGKSAEGKSGYGPVGAVVGATYPEQLKRLRQELPHTFFLVPGYGAQGGGAEDAAGAFHPNGLGAVVNSSRAIMYAWKKGGTDGHDFAQAAAGEAVRMKKELLAFTGTIHV